MAMDDGLSVYVNNKVLRCGHTTGTCAAAASKAAAVMAITGKVPGKVTITTPGGVTFNLPVEDPKVIDGKASCAVRKDGGDDIDVTHGTLVYSEVTLTSEGISIDGGKGVGRVTRKGLDQPPGNAAINRVPRTMISIALEEAATDCDYEGGFSAIISVPDGERIAESTFNPRLGIVGGISILGTTGIVEPMSEAAIIKTIEAEMDMKSAEGAKVMLVVPGNYGRDFADSIGIDSESAVKCSNFIGPMLDHACMLNTDILLIGNLGKLVKLAGGIMNTHSREADSRMEILAAYAIMAGGSADLAREVMGCLSTDDALAMIDKEGLIAKVSDLLAKRIEYHMEHRTGGRIRTAAIIYSSVYGLLSRTSLADELLAEIRGAA